MATKPQSKKTVGKVSSATAKKPVAKPAAKPVPKKIAKAPAKPAPKKVAKAPAKPAPKSVAKAPAKPTPKPVAKSPAKPAPKPVAKAPAKPAPAAQPAIPAVHAAPSKVITPAPIAIPAPVPTPSAPAPSVPEVAPIQVRAVGLSASTPDELRRLENMIIEVRSLLKQMAAERSAAAMDSAIRNPMTLAEVKQALIDVLNRPAVAVKLATRNIREVDLKSAHMSQLQIPAATNTGDSQYARRKLAFVIQDEFGHKHRIAFKTIIALTLDDKKTLEDVVHHIYQLQQPKG